MIVWADEIVETDEPGELARRGQQRPTRTSPSDAGELSAPSQERRHLRAAGVQPRQRIGRIAPGRAAGHEAPGLSEGAEDARRRKANGVPRRTGSRPGGRWTGRGFAGPSTRSISGTPTPTRRPSPPIRQRLVMVPRDRHGDQCLLEHQLDRRRRQGRRPDLAEDVFGNRRGRLRAQRVASRSSSSTRATGSSAAIGRARRSRPGAGPDLGRWRLRSTRPP